MRITMTAANFRPAVANRRDKYYDNFRVQTLLGDSALSIDMAV